MCGCGRGSLLRGQRSEALVNEGVSTHWTMARVRVTRCGVAAEERLDSDASLFAFRSADRLEPTQR